jgi:hypothetical protein
MAAATAGGTIVVHDGSPRWIRASTSLVLIDG